MWFILLTLNIRFSNEDNQVIPFAFYFDYVNEMTWQTNLYHS